MVDEESKICKQPGRNGFIIPSGFLIGLGVGLLVDHVVSGLLIGVGFGFAGSELISLIYKRKEGDYPQMTGTNITDFLIGVFLIFVGIGIIWAPGVIWPYSISGFLILMGIWILIRELSNIS